MTGDRYPEHIRLGAVSDQTTAGKVDDDTATRRVMRGAGLDYRDALALLREVRHG